MPVVHLVVAQHHLQLILRDLAIAVPARSGAGRLLNLRVRCEADKKDLNVYGIVKGVLVLVETSRVPFLTGRMSGAHESPRHWNFSELSMHQYFGLLWLGFNIGALKIRIGYYSHHKEPHNGIGNYLSPYSRVHLNPKP